MNKPNRSNRRVLLGIFILFFTPLLLALLMHSDWWSFEPVQTTNVGELLDPPMPLRLDDLDLLFPLQAERQPALGRWWMIYVYDGSCGQQCERDLAGLRQVHRALGRFQDRVGIAVLSPPGFDDQQVRRLHDIYPQFHQLNSNSTGLARDRRAFLLDPAGNIILAYQPGFDPNDINRDLKRLLNWSKQDNNP